MSKRCAKCGQLKDESEFHKQKSNKDGLNRLCKTCRKEEVHKQRENNYFVHYCRSKKSECKKKGLEYNLTPEYLESIWTGKCPIFGYDLHYASKGMGSHQSAHLDRLDPNKGYIVGNVCWISGRANRIKYDATIEELRAIADWMERATTIPKGSTPKQVETVS
jgi:hypothetical protein